MSSHETVSREIAASAEQVWALVSDLPRMGEWSNENVGGEWLDGAAGPAPGVRFRGANRNGFHRWKTTITIIDSVPGERFSFRVDFMVIPISEWAYDLEPTVGGCTATESWTDARPGWFRPIGHLATGVGDRSEHTRKSMAITLDRLTATVESSPG